MADVRPFRALRPRPDLAGEVIAPPYDVLTEGEARALAVLPRSFVRVTRAEATLPEGTDPHSDEAYRAARTNLDAYRADNTLVLDEAAHYYFYGQQMGPHTQVGILAACSVQEYLDGAVAKHEHTRPDKEDDRTQHMQVLGAQVGLVFLAYRANATLAELTAQVCSEQPLWEVTTPDEVVHRFWIAPPSLNGSIQTAFSKIERLYIADGHHRSAAAARVHATEQSEASSRFLAGLFPDDALQVLAYNRVVTDLGGLSTDAFRAQVEERFVLRPGPPVPDERGTYSMLLSGHWFTLIPKHVPSNDPVRSLDVAVLQDQLLAPILGIDDPRTSDRIAFVGGIRGHAGLESAVAEGAAVAFHLYPTGLDQLFAVADAGQVMPPKSTWFEPKLRGGVAVRLLRA